MLGCRRCRQLKLAKGLQHRVLGSTAAPNRIWPEDAGEQIFWFGHAKRHQRHMEKA
jgi:hypothetical protein